MINDLNVLTKLKSDKEFFTSADDFRNYFKLLNHSYMIHIDIIYILIMSQKMMEQIKLKKLWMIIMPLTMLEENI